MLFYAILKGMAFQPTVLAPTPDPFYVRELRKIDPDLRLVWGYNRYLMNKWVVERRIPPDRYFAMYASLLEEGAPRFVQQPIYDTSQPLYDEEGNEAGYRVVGQREFDLAPDHEYVLAAEALDMRLITELKRAYAWERFHSLTRAKIEKDQEEEARAKALKDKRMDIWLEALDQGYHETGKILSSKPVNEIMEGTEIK